METTQNEIIKTFLKIYSPNFQDKPYYSINKDKNILTIYDPIDKAPSDKSSDFEQDKIFVENEEMPYIYEEMFKNTIKDTLNGISFSYITYGDSNSNKLKLLIGDYKNNNLNHNNMGLFPKFLHNLIKKVKETEKDIKEKISLKISYFLEHDGELIDLSNLRYKNKEKNNFTEEKLFEGKYTIKSEENIIDIIKKIDIEGFKDEIHFLNDVLNLLSKLEENEENKNILTRANICIILYIENKDKISIINFVILNGSEYLYSGKAEQFKSLSNNDNNKTTNKNIIEGTKISLETQYTYETLLNLVKLKIYIDNNMNKSNSKEINLILNKNKQNSKLTTLLYNIYFKAKKMYFRILGTVIPNIGLYQSFKDTLIFLLDFHKLRNSYQNQFSSSINNNIYNKIKNNIKKSRQSKNYGNNYEEVQKDNLIFELENKVNTYKKIIEDQKNKLSKKEEKIAMLGQTYQEQINIMKKRFNFTGDINILLSGDENTKEAKYIKNLREAAENNIRNEGNLRILQKKIESQEEEIEKLKSKEQIIDSNDTMIKYYVSVKQTNEEKNKKDKDINKLRNVIEELNKKLALKDKIIDKYKKEIESKTKILFNLPKCLKNTYSNSLSDENKNKTNRESNNLENDNNIEKNESLETDNLYNEEMEKIKKQNQKKLDVMKLNYENIIKEKNNIIKQLEYDYEQLKVDKNIDINKYGNEIVKLNKILMNLISNYKRIYFSNLTERYSIINLNIKKEEFDKIIKNIDHDINIYNFPLLFQFLLKNKRLKDTQPLLYNNFKNIYSPITKLKKDDEEGKIKEKEKQNVIENNLKSNVPVNDEQLSQVFKEETNNGKIIYSKEMLEEMSKESIILHCININKKLIGIENYLKKYTEYKKGFNVEEFEIGEKYKDKIIEELNNKIKKLSINLEEQVKINNKNICVINSQNRKIDKLQKENIVFNNLLNHRKLGSSIITPNKSTIYNSSAIDFNSFNSNNSLSKNDKSLKKSNSLMNINKSRQPFSPKAKKILNNNNNNDLFRPISPKIKDFTINKIKNKLYLS